jgi:hypothetical protein
VIADPVDPRCAGVLRTANAVACQKHPGFP